MIQVGREGGKSVHEPSRDGAKALAKSAVAPPILNVLPPCAMSPRILSVRENPWGPIQVDNGSAQRVACDGRRCRAGRAGPSRALLPGRAKANVSLWAKAAVKGSP